MKDSIKNITDTIKSTVSEAQKIETDSVIEKEWLVALFENNPGLLTVAITGFLFPLVFMYLTNRNSRKIKKLEKELEVDYSSREDLRTQEKAVYGALSKILFDVQQLYVSLSGTCIDKNCITNAVTKFDSSMAKYHEEISDNMLYMSSLTINEIYKFYGKIGDLKVELKEHNDKEKYDMAHVLIYMYSEELAEIIIDLQERLVNKRKGLKIEFDKTQQEMMKYCCGDKPPKEQFERYLELKMELNPGMKEKEIELLRLRWG